ncbi:hypothetical protein AB0F81_41695 [Actinoplanes sp. NPDC024001]|uniref:hypothetical protein n=1 Tax=Actinoplanes sp. NPDC024001 TaxID=3154598 RepID=UPI0033F7B630
MVALLRDPGTHLLPRRIHIYPFTTVPAGSSPELTLRHQDDGLLRAAPPRFLDAQLVTL